MQQGNPHIQEVYIYSFKLQKKFIQEQPANSKRTCKTKSMPAPREHIKKNHWEDYEHDNFFGNLQK